MPKVVANLGSTSFLSAMVQCLLHIPPLTRFFLASGHNKMDCFVHNGVDESSLCACLLCNFRDLCFAVRRP